MAVFNPGTAQNYGGGSHFGPSSNILRMQQQNINLEIITQANPWMAEDPITLMELASSGLDPEELANNASAMAGMEGLDRMREGLENLDSVAQRSAYSKLTEQQQRGLNHLGFTPGNPLEGGKGFLDDTLLEKPWDYAQTGLNATVGTAMRPLANTVSPQIGRAFDSMIWLSDVPAHFYRAIRQMEGWQQWLALGVGVAAVGLTGGAALTAMGALGGAAMAGGVGAAGMGIGTLQLGLTVGSIGLAGAVAGTAPMAITNRTEWWDMMNPWGTTGVRRGERIFDKNSQMKSRQMLGGADHIDAMARDIAAGMDAYDFAQDFAGVMDASSISVMTSSIERVAKGLADPGTQEYQTIYEGLAELVELPEFRKAVETLQDGKISVGRDIAGSVGIHEGDPFHGWISGGIDAAWLLTMDPMMAAGKIGKIARIGRRGLVFDGAPEAGARLVEVINTQPKVGMAVDQMMLGIATDDFAMIPKAWRGFHRPIKQWQASQRITGRRQLDREAFIHFIDDASNIGQFMAGKGNVKGIEQVILSGTNNSKGWGKFMYSVRRFQQGMTDEVYLKTIRQEAKKHGDDVVKKLDHDMPIDYHEQKMDLSWQPVKAHPQSDLTIDPFAQGAAVGKMIALTPGGRSLGRFIGSISTMTPANKMIVLAGDQAAEDIPRFVETIGRHFSMATDVRAQWLNEIMEKGTVGQRRQVIYSFMNNLFEVGGMNATDEGRELAMRYMNKYKQAFGQGGQDLVEVGGLSRNVGFFPEVHQADALMVPNLREMSKISRNGHLLKNVTRMTDHELLEGMMTRYIKPGWLLRIGFVPRNVGEEMLAYFVKMSEWSLTQEMGARHVGKRNVLKEIYAKLEAAGGNLAKLHPDEAVVIANDTVPTFLKPVAAMGRRRGWAPINKDVLNRRSDWMADNLREGFVKWDTKKLSPWKRELLLGRKYSVRNMLVNGVDPTFVKAGELWTMRHSDAIMKAVSSLNASAFERAYMNPNSTSMKLPNEQGLMEEVAVILTGERGKVKFNDMRFAGALHHTMTEWLGDTKINRILADFATRLWTQGDGVLQKANVIEAIELSRKIQNSAGDTSFAGRTMLQEMIQWDAGNAMAAADKFDNFPEFAHALRQASRSSDPDKLSVVQLEMRNHAAEHAVISSEMTYDAADKANLIERNKRLEMVNGVAEKMEELRPLYEGLDALSDSERAWMGQMISRDIADPMDLGALTAWKNGDSAAPKMMFHRGTSGRGGEEVLPNGDLLIHPTGQTHLGERKGVTMSLDPVQSAKYTRGPRTAGSIEVSSGTMYDIDAEWALATNNMTPEDLSGNARNFKDAIPEDEAGLGLWGKSDDAATDVVWLSEEPVIVPAGKWQAKTQEDMAELLHGAAESGSPFAQDVANMGQHVGGYEVSQVVESFKANTANLLTDMAPEEQVLFTQLLEEDREKWAAFFAVAFEDDTARPPAPLFDFMHWDTPIDVQGRPEYASLNAKLEEWMSGTDELDTGFRNMLEGLEDQYGGLADYFREEMGLATVASLDPLQASRAMTQGSTERGSIAQLMDTDFSARGGGGFAPEIDGWQPMFDDFNDWEEALQNELYQELARPENAEAVRQSDHMLQGADGQPVARPPEEGVARLYQPSVPRDIGHLDNMLTSPRFQPVLEKEVQESLSMVANVLDNPRLAKAQQRLWGEIQYLSTRSIDGLEAGKHPINRAAQRAQKSIQGNRSPQEVQKALNAGESITANPYVLEQTEQLLSSSTRQKQWDDIAREMVRSPRSVAFTDDTVHAMTEDEKINIVSRALRNIQSNHATYSQPVTFSLEQMAFDSPSIARWLTSILSNGPLDAAASARVGQIDVARSAIHANGEWNAGVRLASVDNGSGTGRFWQLDDTHRGASIPVDAQTVHWFGRGEAPALGSGRMVEHGSYVVGDGYDAALKNWSGKIKDNWVSSQRRGVHESVTVSGEGVARKGINGYEPIPVGERLELNEEYYQVKLNGQVVQEAPVDIGDTRYFSHELTDMDDDLMWNVLGPAVRDHWETVSGDTTKVIRKTPKKGKSLQVGENIDASNEGGADIITMTRSRMEDVRKEGDFVPNLTVSKNFDRVHDLKWDSMVRWGFNKVIGPLMDSLSRKPMSFHYFAHAYAQNMAALPWMLDTKLFRNSIPEEFGDLLHLFEGETNLTDAERKGVRSLARLFGDDLDSADPTDMKQYLLSLGDGPDEIKLAVLDQQKAVRGSGVQKQIDAGADGSKGLSLDGTKELEISNDLEVLINNTNFDLIRYGIDSPGLGASNSERFVEFYHDLVPDEIWDEGAVAVKNFLQGQEGVYADFTAEQWRVLHAARGNLKHVMQTAEDTASVRAMENVIPFIDSHEQRSMMAEYGRNFIPFWYAQENFIKRWARTMSTSPVWGADQLRKLQLGYMGLKSAAVVRTDPNGKDWVVYPGSGLLVEAVSAIPGMDHKPIGVLFQASTDSMLPGIESDLGASSLSPFVAMPVQMVTHFFPESADMKRSLLGDVGGSRSVISQFVPGIAQNLWTAAFENEESNARYASAMMTAISMSEAEGDGLKENATAYEIDEYLDEMRNHARVILFAQAITGFVVPGAPSSIATGEGVGSFGWMSGIGVESPGQLASTLYREYLTNLGPEKGTMAFLKAFPKADLEDVVNPLAYTQSASDSVSKAPLPATEKGMSWYNEHKGWIDSMPEAGAWFLPTDDDDSQFDYYSYSQQFTNGLRKRKSPEDFITAVKYRTGADLYFKEKERYEEAQLAIGKNNSEGLQAAAIQYDNWKSEYLTVHPIFAEELQSGQSRVRRERTIRQLRYAVSDPMAAPSPHLAAIQQMVSEFDRFQAALLKYKYDRTADGQSAKRAIKLQFGDWADRWKRNNPHLDRLWSSVYEPESDLN